MRDPHPKEQDPKVEEDPRVPKEFERCVQEGGKVVTKSLGGGRYMRLCRDKGGRWHQGEVKEKKKKGERG